MIKQMLGILPGCHSAVMIFIVSVDSVVTIAPYLFIISPFSIIVIIFFIMKHYEALAAFTHIDG